MRVLVELFISPITWLVIGFFIYRIKRKQLSGKQKFVYAFILIIYTYLITTPFLPEKLISYLEDQYQPFELRNIDTDAAYNIIVLGGGMGYDDRLPPTSLLEPVMLVRLIEGIRVHNLLPESKLITSGYSSIGRKPQGEVAREAAITLGVNPRNVFAQGTPSNTIEEAEAYINVWGTQTPIIISTSATHIPRAVYIFKNAGVKKVIAAPTHYKIKKQSPRGFWRNFKPRVGYIGELNACLHEIVGLWYAGWVMPKESHSDTSLREPTQPNNPVAK